MRIDRSISYEAERNLLVSVATSIPKTVTPDQLTVLGLCGALLGFVGYLASRWNLQFLWLANIGLLMNWIGDSLDGTLARVRHQEREIYGFYVDRTTDVLSQILLGVGLGLTPFVHFDLACLALVSYLALVAYMLIRERTFGTMQISFMAIGPTEVRLSMVVLNVFMMYVVPGRFFLLHRLWTSYDVPVLVFAAGIFFALPIAVVLELRRAARLPRPEPKVGNFRAAHPVRVPAESN